MISKISNPNPNEWSMLLKRPTSSFEELEPTVSGIFDDVKRKGDAAIVKYTNLFDGIVLENFKVSKGEITNAASRIPNQLKEAIDVAKQNIFKFHSSQKIKSKKVITTEGVKCWQERRAIQKVGLYIPGGSAPLFSTVLMLALPAQIAGVNEIILCTPPNKYGKIADEILYTAQLCGVTKIYKVGGIQAISGLTFGTNTIPKVDKIFGPGNQFVTAAKQVATKFGVAIDMPAGPSELLIVADESAKSNFVASDLLSQAEHGADSQVILVSTSKQLIDDVEKEIALQLESLPRQHIAQQAINNSKLIYVDSKEMALRFINAYAPEHLIISTTDNTFYIENIINAGSVFVGNYTPESAGDYASGTNHTLPTNGYSKAYSGVNLDSFMKIITFQEISETGLLNIGKAIEVMAEAEGLQAHKYAVTLRLKELKIN